MANENEGLLVEIGLSERQYAQALARLERQTVSSAKKAEKQWANTNAKFVSGANKANSAAGAFSRNGLRQMGLQLNQVAQQGAVTGNYLQALAIQLPDLALGFGGVGVAVGTAIGFMTPFILSMFDAEDGAEVAAKSLDGLKESVGALGKALEIARQSMPDLTEEFGDGAEKARAFNLALVELAKLESFASLQSAAAALGEQLEDMAMGLERVEGYFTTSRADALAEKYGLTYAEIQNVVSALEAMKSATGPEEMVAAAERLTKSLMSARDESGNIPPELREVSKTAAEAAVEALRLAGHIEDAERLAGELASIDMASNFGLAADEAARLAGNAQGAVAAFNALSRAAAIKSGAIEDSAVKGGRGTINPDGIDIQAMGAGGIYYEYEKKKSRKSGGSKKKGETSIFDQTQREIQALQMKIDMIGMTTSQMAAYEAQTTLLNEAKKRGLDLDTVNAATGKTLRQEIEGQAAAIGRLTLEYEQLNQRAEFWNGIQDDLKSGLIDAIVEGQNLAGVFADLAKQIAKAALQAALFGEGPMAGMFGGSGSGLFGSAIGSIFGGFRAGGGSVSPSKGYIVGENGPEWFQPKSAGTIIPNNRLMAPPDAIKSGAGSYAAPQVNVSPAGVKVVIVDDQSRIGDYLKSAEGERVLAAQMARLGRA